MNYVMEVGPLADGEWVLFSVDDEDGQLVELCASLDREKARAELALLIRGKPAQCCSSLRSFGEAHGWVPAPPHQLAREVTAWAAVCIENFTMLGGMQPDPRLIEAWLRSCANYLAAKPWEHLRGLRRRLLDVHLDGAIKGRKAVCLFGDEKKHRILIADSVETLLDDGGPMGVPSNCISQVIYSERGATSDAIGQIYERPFVPRLLCTQRGELATMAEPDLVLLTGVASAVASLCEHRTYGRSEVLGLETLVLPLSLDKAKEKQ